MKKILLSLLLTTALSVTMLAGCGDSSSESSAPSVPAESSDSGAKTSQESTTKTERTGLLMSVDNDDTDTDMTIDRAPVKNTPMGEKNTWTIFLYLCGTDLESTGQGSATSDISQILDATPSDKITYVIQTGGTSQWMNDEYGADQSERYIIRDGKQEKIESGKLSNMGDPATLQNFLSWGVKTYPAEKMGVIFWDHGSGSINGVCFDELNNSDSLSLPELNQAFSNVYSEMTDQFEFIGFDACLMATVETANILSTYSRYMVASQETEPGSGWDYTTFTNYLGEHPDQNGAELGKVIADSFYEECKLTEEENGATLTVVDLSKIDPLVTEFNNFSRKLYQDSLENDKFAEIVRIINSVENFGGNNKTEGYTNMIDLGGILNGYHDTGFSGLASEALQNCIVYHKNGANHPEAAGLSIYYPLQVEGSEELKMFSSICISPYYLSITDKIANGSSEDGYNNDVFFDDNGMWITDNCECKSFDNSYFSYADEASEDDSKLITFEKEPYMDENGFYGFILDEEGLQNTAQVSAFLFLETDGNLVMLGETNDVCYDFETGKITDNFDGYWFSLPNGQLLPTYIVEVTSDAVIYTSPIYLNGTRTNLRIRQTEEDITIEGAWDGINDNIAARGITKLKKDDKIEVIYYLDDDSEFKADPYQWQENDTLIYQYLPEADYYYAFCIEDVYGDYLITDPTVFSVTADGSITFSAGA